MQKLLLSIVLTFGLAWPMFADAITDRVVANLENQGFTVVQMDRTWLGRMWILAESLDVRREIVFNPVTGEILRDYAVRIALNDQSEGTDGDKVARKAGADGASPLATGSAGQADPALGVGAAISPPDDISLDPVNPIPAQ